MRVTEGSARGSVHPLDAPMMTIGRTPAGGIRQVGWVHLKDETVSKVQAELQWSDETKSYTLTNRSETNPTKVNEVVVGEPVVLKPGDQIRCGNCVLDLQKADMRFVGRVPQREPRAETLPPPPPPVAPLQGLVEGESKPAARPVTMEARASFYLEILEGPNAGLQVAVRGQTLALGGPLGEEDVLANRWFDQEFPFGDRALPPRCLALVFREAEQDFELVSPEDCTVPVSVIRVEDGMQWTAQLAPGASGLVQASDTVQLGRNRFQIML